MSGRNKIFSVSLTHFRNFSLSSSNYGKRNFRKFQSTNKRGTTAYREGKLQDHFIDHRGVRPVGIGAGDHFKLIPELIPDIVVPDMKDFNLKPYVSYRVPDITQSKFTSKDLFNATYSKKIIEDFKSGKLDESGNPLEPSLEEALQPKEAWENARKTGSDMF
ncbi:39S ribosomal protein L41, mitochondrial [Nymphon striatum]|nr:39S ribosomal protein L41, mitochondrial [Nymphon striatum]